MSDLFYDNPVFILAISIVSSVELWSCSKSVMIITGLEESIGVFCECLINPKVRIFYMS